MKLILTDSQINELIAELEKEFEWHYPDTRNRLVVLCRDRVIPLLKALRNKEDSS